MVMVMMLLLLLMMMMLMIMNMVNIKIKKHADVNMPDKEYVCMVDINFTPSLNSYFIYHVNLIMDIS